jgi:hypothetical protein
MTAAAFAVDASAAIAKERCSSSSSSSSLDAEAMSTKLSLPQQSHLGDWFTSNVPSFWRAFRHLQVLRCLFDEWRTKQHRLRCSFSHSRVPHQGKQNVIFLEIGCFEGVTARQSSTPC